MLTIEDTIFHCKRHIDLHWRHTKCLLLACCDLHSCCTLPIHNNSLDLKALVWLQVLQLVLQVPVLNQMNQMNIFHRQNNNSIHTSWSMELEVGCTILSILNCLHQKVRVKAMELVMVRVMVMVMESRHCRLLLPPDNHVHNHDGQHYLLGR